MKKIISILSVALLPMVSFAQSHGFRMMDYGGGGYGSYGFESNSSVLGMFLVLLIPIIWIVCAIGLFVFWLLMLIDAIKHSPEKTKIVWILVIIFTHVIGALVYYFVEKRPRNKKKGHEHKVESEK